LRQRNESKKPRNTTYVPLDGGYGWVVVFGAFFVQFWVAGLVKSYGVLYVEVMETFKDSSASVASWIPAILTCLCLALGESSCCCQGFFSFHDLRFSRRIDRLESESCQRNVCRISCQLIASHSFVIMLKWHNSFYKKYASVSIANICN